MRFFKVRLGSVLWALTLVALFGALSPTGIAPVPAAAGPALEVTPATGLADGQSIHIRGSGFVAGQALSFALCRAGAANVSACPYGAGVTAGPTGIGEVDLTVGPIVVTANPVESVDCRDEGACEIVAFLASAGGAPQARAAVAFSAEPPFQVPQVSVRPSTGLLHRQMVAVSGSGFARSTRVVVSLCSRTGTACQFAASGAVAADGSFSVSAQMTGIIGSVVDGSTEDCRATPTACVLLADATPSHLRAFAPVSFDPAAPVDLPVLAVAPASGLVDGQNVAVTGSGFRSRSGVTLVQCVVGAPDATSCSPTLIGAGVDVDGRLATSYTVSAFVPVAGQERVDCRVRACELRVLTSHDPTSRAAAPLAFAPGGALEAPPTLAVSPSAGIVDGQAVAVQIGNMRPPAEGALFQCPAGVAEREHQRCRMIETVTATPSGTSERQVILDSRLAVPGASPSAPGAVDCTVAPGCTLVLATTNDWVVAPLTFSAAAGTRYRDRVFGDVEVSRDLVYGRAVGDGNRPVDLTLDLYQPRGDALGARPAIVYVHGGYFSRGDKSEGAQVATELARRGYVVVSVDYRLYAGGDIDLARLSRAMPAAQHDAQAAVRWLRARATTYRLSTAAIGMIGYSAGGITSLNVANHAGDPGDSGNPGVSSGIAGAVSLSGAAGGFEAGAPPVLLVHGGDDKVVSYESAVETCTAARAVGNQCELVSFPGVGHDIYSRYTDWMPKVVSFYEATVVRALSGAPGAAPDRLPAPIPVSATPRYTY